VTSRGSEDGWGRMPVMRWTLLALSLLTAASGCASSGSRERDAARLDSMIGKVTRADVIQHLGPPNQTMTVDGDDFFMYTATVGSRTLDWADALSGFGAGMQGRPYTSAPRQQQTYILRFDGVTGKLKGWGVR